VVACSLLPNTGCKAVLVPKRSQSGSLPLMITRHRRRSVCFGIYRQLLLLSILINDLGGPIAGERMEKETPACVR
jgi:hypothetical protein